MGFQRLTVDIHFSRLTGSLHQGPTTVLRERRRAVSYFLMSFIEALSSRADSTLSWSITRGLVLAVSHDSRLPSDHAPALGDVTRGVYEVIAGVRAPNGVEIDWSGVMI